MRGALVYADAIGDGSDAAAALLYAAAIVFGLPSKNGRRPGGEDGGGGCATEWQLVEVEDVGYRRGEGAAQMSLYDMLVSRRGVSSASCARVRERGGGGGLTGRERESIREREGERERERERERVREG